MKNLIVFIFGALLILGSSKFVYAQQYGDFYIGGNGILKCEDAPPGETTDIEGVTYTAVADRATLKTMIGDGIDPLNVCTTHVTEMNSLFFYKSAFNQDIGNWDVSKVTNMSDMFFGAEAFDQDIGKWDVSKVINMDKMFNTARVFNQDIGNWDVSQVTNMDNMFVGATVFNQDVSFCCVSKIGSSPTGFSP